MYPSDIKYIKSCTATEFHEQVEAAVKEGYEPMFRPVRMDIWYTVFMRKPLTATDVMDRIQQSLRDRTKDNALNADSPAASEEA